MIDKKDFKGQMLRLDAMFYPGKFDGDVGRVLLQDYYRSLKGINIDVLRKSIDAMIDGEEDFRGFKFPGPGQIRIYARPIARDRIAREEVKKLAEPVNKNQIEQIIKIAGPVKRI